MFNPWPTAWRSLVKPDMSQKVIAGSRMNLLMRLFEQKTLTSAEQIRLQEILQSMKKK